MIGVDRINPWEVSVLLSSWLEHWKSKLLKSAHVHEDEQGLGLILTKYKMQQRLSLEVDVNILTRDYPHLQYYLNLQLVAFNKLYKLQYLV
jgi:hypothetical protein